MPAISAAESDDFTRLNLIGRSPSFLAALLLIKKYASCDATVLIEGETGTGKELAARAIHHLSRRRNLPFIPLNCGAPGKYCVTARPNRCVSVAIWSVIASRASPGASMPTALLEGRLRRRLSNPAAVATHAEVPMETGERSRT